MENLEINKTAKELAEEAIRSDIEHINSILDNLCLSEISKGYKFIVVDTNEALCFVIKVLILQYHLRMITVIRCLGYQQKRNRLKPVPPLFIF